MKDLIKEIEKERKKMEQIYIEKGSLNNYDILNCSKKLDELIVKFIKEAGK